LIPPSPTGDPGEAPHLQSPLHRTRNGVSKVQSFDKGAAKKFVIDPHGTIAKKAA
jgi:hypothetical protein